MTVPALYFATASSAALPVDIRVHTKIQNFGDLAGGGGGWAERVDTIPRLILPRSSAPQRNAAVSVEPGEAYLIAVIRPADDEFVTVEVTDMSPSQIATRWPNGQPLP